jgi:hypothetical protein
LIRYAFHLYPIGSGVLELRVCEAVLQGTVIGQQHQAFTIFVQTADGVDCRYLYIVGQGGALAGELADDAVWFVEEDVAQEIYATHTVFALTNSRIP